MQIHTRTLSLPDGRTLAYAEYGATGGYPLVWIHGNPGCRRDPDLLDPTLLQRLHIRAIVPDRPGIGQSTFKTQRRLVDWPTDLAALAAALKLERFALLGISGGAPYVAACARAMPHRITRAGIVSGVAPLEALDPETRRAHAPSIRYFTTASHSYWWVRGLLWLMRRGLSTPDKLMAQVLATLPPADQEALSDPRVRQAFLALLHESLRQGTRGLAWDAVVIARPWGFDLREITLPVTLWHGEADRNAPPAMAEYLAGEFPHGHITFYPDEGHFSLALRHMESILQTLMVPGDFTDGQ